MSEGLFRPFGMSDDEYERRLEVREQIPEILRPPLLAWADRQVTDFNGSVTEARGHELQSALRVPLELDHRYTDPAGIVAQFESQGDRELLFLIDYLLSEFEEDTFVEPGAIEDLRWHMDQTRSALTIAARDGEYRLAHRLPDGVEELLVSSAIEANATAGAHLRNAIREATTLDGKPSLVMSEDIRAVEAAAGPVVTPKDQRFQLSKIVSALKAKTGWSLLLQRRDDGEPDHRAVLIGMLETIAFAQRDRHSGTPPTSEEAQAHMMLTATVVGWFSTGVVLME
ncbi:hypothetical protein [Microbacterium sp. K27]|uniref:hypothetical protein n=1 Tax=Microbacterium sp. K27 TaxID=2305445 RepID=UPI00109B8329|nr:hypothetical protein [Microbacterium sp. K27]